MSGSIIGKLTRWTIDTIVVGHNAIGLVSANVLNSMGFVATGGINAVEVVAMGGVNSRNALSF